MGRKSIPRANNTPTKRMIAYIMGRLLGKFITMATIEYCKRVQNEKNAQKSTLINLKTIIAHYAINTKSSYSSRQSRLVTTSRSR